MHYDFVMGQGNEKVEKPRAWSKKRQQVRMLLVEATLVWIGPDKNLRMAPRENSVEKS